MFWRFGFSSTSTLDTLLDKPNVTVEEVLDEEDLLQECKSQNQKLIDYLQQPRVLKRLLEHVVGTARVGGTGGKDWEEKVKFKYPYIASEVLSCEIWAIVELVLSKPEEFLEPFWNAVLTSKPIPSEAPLPIHSHPLFSENNSQTPGQGAPNLSILGGLSEAPHMSDNDSSKDNAIRSTTALENGPGRSVLAGYWAKVNGVFLEKKPREMLNFIQGLPRIVERFVAHLETPAVVDLLFRIIQVEETMPNAGVIDWLSSNELISQTVDLLAPTYSVDLHNTVSELLKAIIALSAPSPASLNQGQGPDALAADAFGQQNIGGINNRLVRELASEPVVRKMVGFMLDSRLPHQLTRRLTDVADEQLAKIALDDGSGSKFRKPSMLRPRPAGLSTLQEDGSNRDSALDDDDDDNFVQPLNPREFPASELRQSSGPTDHRDSTVTVRPSTFFPDVSAPTVAVTKETSNSSLVTCISVFIELIRKNNSDYFEQHLFHTLRTHLLQRQQELAEKRAQRAIDEVTEHGNNADDDKGDTSANEEDEEMEGMEEAMAEMADKLGIVHLGPMLQILSERLSDFQDLIMRPRDQEPKMSTTIGEISPLTFERYRITELYAELLHCSNMALLNRGPGEGPQYSVDGMLTGGIEGLQVLARTLQGGDGPEMPEGSTGGDGPSGEAQHPADETDNSDLLPQAADKENDVATKAEKSQDGEKESSHEEAQDATQTSHTRQASSHVREKASTGGNSLDGASEDTEDEALLNEVSVSDSIAESETTPAAGKDEDHDAAEKEAQQKKDDEDAQSIKSALSGLSLAELTSPHPSGPPSPIDDSREYVVGDLLKKKFLECGIIPSLLDLFFEYPWNNFLHNVVYDILQQFFNGRMDVGLNRKLTMAVFEQGKLTQRIIEGHTKNEDSMKGPRKIRLGYMGHMNLIAEETVKLLERYPLEIARPISSALDQPAWDEFVNETLRENREKEAGPLAGGRPSAGASMSFGTSDDDGDSGQLGGNSSFASYLSSQIGGAAGGSDDDDSDEEASWMSHDINSGARSGGFDDAFAPRGGSEDQDDDWGPFADPSDSENKTRFDFPSTSGTSSSNNPFAQNLTPADWSAQFRREGTPEMPVVEDDDSSSNDSDGDAANKDGDTPFVDLLDPSTLKRTDVVANAHARRPSLTQLEAPESTEWKPRAGAAAAGSPTDAAASQATDEDSPLGPGVPADIEQRDDGMLQRTLDDGTTVVVPLDEVALAKDEGDESGGAPSAGDKTD